MSSSIWNEGRVVGYSAYEIYVKQFYSEPQPDPAIPPASERQWLASSLAMGSSLLLKLPILNSAYTKFVDSPDCHDYYIDIPLPNGSKLVAANNIIASFFEGDAALGNDSYWAAKITSYGDLIPNNDTTHPSNSSVPVDTTLTVQQSAFQRLNNYLKVVDGIVYMPRSWANSPTGVPSQELDPNFASSPTLRLHVHGEFEYTTAPWILLTGFTLKSVIFGESIKGVSTNTDVNLYRDGGFLGPAVFPWSNKVIFTLPASYDNLMRYDIDADTEDISYSLPSTAADAGNEVAQKSTISVTQNGVTSTVSAISLKLDDGTEVTISGDPSSSIKLRQDFLGYNTDGTTSNKIGAANEADNLTWGTLLAALANNQSIDILGSRLSNAKRTLRKSQADNDVEGGRGAYLEFGRGDYIRRFYICANQPTPESGQTIPDGSIGIGWQMS